MNTNIKTINYYLKYLLYYIPIQIGIVAFVQATSIPKNELLYYFGISNTIFFTVFCITNIVYYKIKATIPSVINTSLTLVIICIQLVMIISDTYRIQKYKDEFYGDLNTLTVIPRMSSFHFYEEDKIASMSELHISLDEYRDSTYAEVEKRDFGEQRLTFKVDPDFKYRINILFWGIPISQVETKNLYKAENRIIRIVTTYKRPVKFIFSLSNNTLKRDNNNLVLKLKGREHGPFIRETPLNYIDENTLVSKDDQYIWSNKNQRFPYILYIVDQNGNTLYKSKFNFDATQFEFHVVLEFNNVELSNT